MMNLLKPALAGLALMSLATYSVADPTVGTTTVLGPFTGPGATLHSDNVSPYSIAYYGTDLGFSYEHDGDIEFLFGDTWADSSATAIESSTGTQQDDGFGTVDLSSYSNPSLFSSSNIPLIKLGQHASTQMKALDPVRILDLGKTPMAGFSNGSREFGIFTTTKPEGCLYDSDCDDLLSDLTCDNGLGFWGEEYYEDAGFTGGCIDWTFGCLNDTMANIWGFPIAGTGFCSDETSTVHGTSDGQRLNAVGLRTLVGIRSTTDNRDYTNIEEWLSNKFANLAAATAEDFVPANGSGYTNQDYNVATGSGADQRVFLWGRPGFIGVDAKSRNLGLYFAYVDMPTGSTFTWTVNYYTGTVAGVSQFSTDEADAEPLDLDSGTAGIQADEDYDVVNQMSVVWVDHLNKWIMFYGGGTTDIPTIPFTTCGVLELFTGPECTDVVIGNGAIRMRSADDPWGPWSPPEDVIVGGDPDDSPLADEYAAGGMLRHPDCSGTCAPHSAAYSTDEYGFLYGANIIQPWIKAAGSSVDVIWNVSTWDPYRVMLLRTRIDP